MAVELFTKSTMDAVKSGLTQGELGGEAQVRARARAAHAHALCRPLCLSVPISPVVATAYPSPCTAGSMLLLLPAGVSTDTATACLLLSWTLPTRPAPLSGFLMLMYPPVILPYTQLGHVRRLEERIKRRLHIGAYMTTRRLLDEMVALGEPESLVLRVLLTMAAAGDVNLTRERTMVHRVR